MDIYLRFWDSFGLRTCNPKYVGKLLLSTLFRGHESRPALRQLTMRVCMADWGKRKEGIYSRPQILTSSKTIVRIKMCIFTFY